MASTALSLVPVNAEDGSSTTRSRVMVPLVMFCTWACTTYRTQKITYFTTVMDNGYSGKICTELSNSVATTGLRRKPKSDQAGNSRRMFTKENKTDSACTKVIFNLRVT